MEVTKGKKPHVLAVPFPAQGHVKPLMKLSRQIAKRGIKVTFVNIERVHEKIVAAAKLSGEKEAAGEDDEYDIVMASIPDERSPDDDPNDTLKLLETLRISMPGFLTDLIEKINSSSADEKISCVIADVTISWVLEIAREMEAEPVIFSPASAAALVIIYHIPKLLEEGKLDPIGSVKCGEIISIADGIPPWKKNELSWNFPLDLDIQKIFFECSLRIENSTKNAKWLLSNTCYELEPSACDLIPGLLPIGPLLDSDNLKSSDYSSFHPEDASCLTWLDNKPAGSVIYVSFGSLAVFSQQQLEELALGLELSGQAFLWVSRSDLANGSAVVHPEGFLERVSEVGKIVEWAPQEKVLSHPSVACFLSHCGWNSTIEGLSRGVSFLCWPYFADQHHNQNYICDEWKIGLRIDADESGIRTRDEIKKKIDMVFSDEGLKANALKLKEMCGRSVGEGGSSCSNIQTFIDHLRK